MGNSAPEPAQSSALHGSIENKKDISYYYAHAPRDQTGEAPAPMPVHRPIATTAYVPGEKVKELKAFQFLDDGKFAKVYLPLEDLTQITADHITSDFQTRSLCVTIRGLAHLPLQFRIARLNNEINPDECVVKILKTKVLLKLKKAVIVAKTSDNDDEAAEADVVDGEAPDGEVPELAKEPTEGVGQSDASESVVSASASIDVHAEAGTAAVSKVKEQYPKWYQLRE
eukprot:jgi/Ulvmu1/4117/UM019_0096.1